MGYTNAHSLPAYSCPNARDLGGYDSPASATGKTRTHRFVRCGGTQTITAGDLDYLRRYGVTHVLDLRSPGESPRLTCRFAKQPWVTWENAPLFERDISAQAVFPQRDANNYLVTSYLSMLESTREVRRSFEFFATMKKDDCGLFHCAAGMDRTGIIAMLLLGLAEVPREQVIADYAYSFGSEEDVRNIMAGRGMRKGVSFVGRMVTIRVEAIGEVYDTVVQSYGSVRDYLASCSISNDALDVVKGHLVS